MAVRMQAKGALGSWLIGAAALGLLVWAMLDFIRLNTAAPIVAARIPVAGELAPMPIAREAIALHRLLPDATDDLGAWVRLDGTVVGAVTAQGVWVRDLRDNVVLVVPGPDGPGALRLATLSAGDAVRIVGRVALLPRERQEQRFAAAGLVLPQTAQVIRDIMIQPAEDGIERLAQ